MKTSDEALLLQDYRKLDELNRARVLERIAALLGEQRQERRRGFRTVAGTAGKKGG